MPSTPAERKALLYLSALFCAGALVRVAGAVRREPPPAEGRAALARQIDAVDSARRAAREGKARAARPRAGKRPTRRAVVSRSGDTPDQPTRDTLHPPAIDIDTASAATLERLPRIGPALAGRIVAERERGGVFGSSEALQRRVRGVGPALARALAGRVTFSPSRRPSRAVYPPAGAPR